MRAAEFAAGRECARRALGEFGVSGFSLLPAANRMPLWPAHLVGSITHTLGFCAAAVAEKRDFRGIGLDAESVAEVGVNLWPNICTPNEIQQLEALPQAEAQRQAALIYSAKEAFYKCQYTVTQQWLDFHDVEISIDSSASKSQFTAHRRPKSDSNMRDELLLTGQFCFEENLVITFVAWPQVDPS